MSRNLYRDTGVSTSDRLRTAGGANRQSRRSRVLHLICRGVLAALFLVAVLEPKPAVAGPDLSGLKKATMGDRGLGVWGMKDYRSLEITFGFGDRHGGIGMGVGITIANHTFHIGTGYIPGPHGPVGRTIATDVFGEPDGDVEPFLMGVALGYRFTPVAIGLGSDFYLMPHAQADLSANVAQYIMDHDYDLALGGLIGGGASINWSIIGISVTAGVLGGWEDKLPHPSLSIEFILRSPFEQPKNRSNRRRR